MPSNILIIDDSKTFRATLTHMIAEVNPDTNIDEAADAITAFNMMKNNHYDCVFLDYILPDMHGVSVLHMIKEQENDIGMAPPVIMLTGSEDYDIITASIKAGALDFMTKEQLSINNLFIVMTKAKQYYTLKQSQKQAEEQLIQAQKMESVGLLAGGIAHDFNNLLTVIFGNVKFLSKRVAKLEGDHMDMIKNIDAIDRSARRGAALVKRLMIFSRQRQLEPKAISLNTLLQDMALLLTHSVGVSIEVNVEFGEDLWPVYMDETQLGSAIMNMAVNARDAMPDGGVLKFTTANTVVSPAMAKELPDIEPGKYVILSISDTGTGIPQEQISKIFDPFYTTKDVGKGTGLGLSMVYGLIKESKGTITVESERGKGTTFVIYLPKTLVAGKAEHETRGSGDRNALKGTGTILVVEDEEDIRALNVDVLKSSGYAILEAANSEEALELIMKSQDTKIDLLFTDIAMPGEMNGVQLAARVSVLSPDTKILFTSGYSENAVPDFNLIKEGQLISKPFDQDEMLHKIKSILKKG